MKLALVVAVAENGVIGDDGDIPWHHPADLRRFKETTMGHPVIMGRRTYESIVDRLGESLPGRCNIVLSRGDPALLGDAVRAESIEAALEIAAAELPADEPDAVAYVIGGAEVYEQFLPRADRLVWTEVHETVAGDTHFPAVDWGAWREVAREDQGDLSFVVYERR